MTPEDVAQLDARASQVGEVVGWQLRFIQGPNPEYVALVAGPDRIAIMGPASLSEMAAHDIELTLDSLERRQHVIELDEDGDPYLVGL